MSPNQYEVSKLVCKCVDDVPINGIPTTDLRGRHSRLMMHGQRSITDEHQQITLAKGENNHDMGFVPEITSSQSEPIHMLPLQHLDMTCPNRTENFGDGDCSGIKYESSVEANFTANTLSAISSRPGEYHSPLLTHELFFESSAIIPPPQDSAPVLRESDRNGFGSGRGRECMSSSLNSPRTNGENPQQSSETYKGSTAEVPDREGIEWYEETARSLELSARHRECSPNSSDMAHNDGGDGEQFSALFAFINDEHPLDCQARLCSSQISGEVGSSGSKAADQIVSPAVPALKNPENADCARERLCRCSTGCQHKRVRSKDYGYKNSSESDSGEATDSEEARELDDNTSLHPSTKGLGFTGTDELRSTSSVMLHTPIRTQSASKSLGSSCRLPRFSSTYKTRYQTVTYTLQSSTSTSRDAFECFKPPYAPPPNWFENEILSRKELSSSRELLKSQPDTLPTCVLTPGKLMSPLITCNPQWLSGPLTNGTMRDVDAYQIAAQCSEEIGPGNRLQLAEQEQAGSQSILKPLTTQGGDCEPDQGATKDVHPPREHPERQHTPGDITHTAPAETVRIHGLKSRPFCASKKRGSADTGTSRSAEGKREACWENRTRFSCRNTVNSIENATANKPAEDVNVTDAEELPAQDAQRSYKGLSLVEQETHTPGTHQTSTQVYNGGVDTQANTSRGKQQNRRRTTKGKPRAKRLVNIKAKVNTARDHKTKDHVNNQKDTIEHRKLVQREAVRQSRRRVANGLLLLKAVLDECSHIYPELPQRPTETSHTAATTMDLATRTIRQLRDMYIAAKNSMTIPV